jgi:hypothetical protein
LSKEGWYTGDDNDMSRIVDEAARSGKLGVRVTDDDADKGSSLGCNKLPCRPGKSYRVTFWGRVRSGKDMSVYLQFFDANCKQLTKVEFGNALVVKLRPGPTDWVQYTLRGTAPRDAATIRIWMHSFTAAKVVADLDDFSLVEE